MYLRSPRERATVKTHVPRAVLLAWIAFGLLEGSAAGQKNAQEDPASGAVRIRVGETVKSALESTDAVLTEKGHYQSFRLVSRKQGKIAIRMLARYFDAYLLVRDQDGKTIASDDDTGLGDGAELDLRVEAGQEYTVLAASSSKSGAGEFRLETRRGEPKKLERREELERDRVWYEEVRTSEITLARKASILLKLGLCYDSLGSPKKASDVLNNALEVYRKLGDRRGEASTLGNLGLVYEHLGQAEKAIAYCEKALDIHREVRNRREEASTLSNLGTAYRNLGQPQKALKHYEKALDIHRQVLNRREEASTLSNLGNAYRDLGQVENAVEYYEQALDIHRQVRNQGEEGRALGDLGIAYAQLGELEKAIQCFEQARDMHRKLGYRRLEGKTLINLGTVYRHLGQLQKALEHCEKALTILREVNDRRGQGFAIANLGAAYGSLGQWEKAIERFEQALAILREVSDRRAEGIALGNLGTAYRNIGRPQKAIKYQEHSLAIKRETGDRRGEGIAVGNLGRAYLDLGQLEKAIQYYEQALDIHREVRNLLFEAATLWVLGAAQLQKGDDQAALDAYRRAYVIESGIIAAMEGGLEESAVRSRSGTIEPRATEYLQLLVKLFRQAESREDRDVLLREALQVTEDLRARTLRSSMRAGDFRGLLSPAGRETWDRIRMLKKKMSTLITSTLEGLRQASADRRLALEKLQAACDGYEDEIVSLERRLKLEEPKFASLFSGGDAFDPKRLEDFLGEKELLLHYNMLGEHVAVFVWDGAHGLDLYVLEVDAKALGEEVRTNVRALSQGGQTAESTSQIKRSLAGLRAKLFRGLESRIESARELVVVPDAFLHLLPFEALVLEDGKYLIERYGLRYAPSIHVLMELHRREKTRAEKKLVVYGDPDFGKRAENPLESALAMRVRGREGFTRLSHAAEELKRVSRLFPKANVVLREGGEATEGRFKRESGRGTILHVATHGRFAQSPGTARLPLFYSGLVFAGYNGGGVGEEDSFLTAAEVMGLDLRAVDLAVLSACETAAGSVRGYEGKFGLERAFFVAGVRSFVGSLWQVDDSATSDLMSSFYRNLEKGVTKTESLRKAKLDFISGRHNVMAGRTNSDTNTDDSKTHDGDRGFRRVPKVTRDLSHPYYWAPFILSGDGTGIHCFLSPDASDCDSGN